VVYDDYGRITQTGAVANLGSSAVLEVLTEAEYKTSGVGFG